jgi:hypothetical protein
MSGPAFRVAYVPWWRPIRLAARHANGYDFIGWAWRQKVYMVRNMHHGWIAFLEDQTEKNLTTCNCCGRPLASLHNVNSRTPPV